VARKQKRASDATAMFRSAEVVYPERGNDKWRGAMTDLREYVQVNCEYSTRVETITAAYGEPFTITLSNKVTVFAYGTWLRDARIEYSFDPREETIADAVAAFNAKARKVERESMRAAEREEGDAA